MAKAFKILSIILLTLIVLIGIGIFLLIHFVDPNKLKSEIGTTVYNTTGHHFTINGNLSWSFFPWIGFKVQDAELDSAPGFENTPLAKIGEADISIRLLPLLTGHLEVHNVELNSLQMNLIRNAVGATNWQMMDDDKTDTTSTTTNKAKINTPSDSDILNFSIANLTVVNSNINWQDQLKKQTYEFKNLYINGHNVGTQQLFPLTISFDLGSNKFSKPLPVSFSGNFNVDNHLDSVAINQIDVNLDNFEVEADLSAKNLKGRANFQGDIHIPAFNLPKFLNNFNITLPKMEKTDALQNLSADIAFNGGNNTLSIKPLKIGIDDTTVNGDINVSNLKTYQTNFKLNVDNLNVDNYMPEKVIHKTTKKKTSSTNTANIPAAAENDQKIMLPIELLRNLNLQGSIGINQFVIANLHMSNLQGNLKANDGVLILSPVTASLYEGNLNGQTSLNVQNSIPAYQLTTNVKGVQGQALLSDLLNKNFISGTADFSADLSTNGNTVNTLLNQLDGSGRFAFNKGQLNGVNVAYEIACTQALLHKKSLPEKPKDNSTPFGTTTGTIKLNNGVATNDDLQINNKYFLGKGKGVINLNFQQLNYTLSIFPQHGDLKTYSIPININGLLNSPRIQLDTNAILKQVLDRQKDRIIQQEKQRAQKKVQQQLNKYVKNKDLKQTLGKILG